MTTALASFQSAFADAVLGRGAAFVDQPAFAVYRNTVMSGWVDALQANYPCVARLVGTEWFRGAAVAYALRHPATDARLMLFGSEFAAFLGASEAARDLPYLAGVARLDRAWTEAHVAADAECDAAHLASVPPRELGAVRVAVHPAARWAWFDALPVFTIWSRQRADDPSNDDIVWRSEGALLTRPGASVQWRSATRAECAFLDACAVARGALLAEAAAAALAAQPQCDLAALFAGLLQAGALSFPAEPETPHEHIRPRQRPHAADPPPAR
jgi:hypothetical protein